MNSKSAHVSRVLCFRERKCDWIPLQMNETRGFARYPWSL